LISVSGDQTARLKPEIQYPGQILWGLIKVRIESEHCAVTRRTAPTLYTLVINSDTINAKRLSVDQPTHHRLPLAHDHKTVRVCQSQILVAEA
jgi:hypothetical protein